MPDCSGDETWEDLNPYGTDLDFRTHENYGAADTMVVMDIIIFITNNINHLNSNNLLIFSEKMVTRDSKHIGSNWGISHSPPCFIALIRKVHSTKSIRVYEAVMLLPNVYILPYLVLSHHYFHFNFGNKIVFWKFGACEEYTIS